MKKRVIKIMQAFYKDFTRRFFAIVWALWFGIWPWQFYEDECHYKEWGYWYHLLMNIGYALKWLLFLETAEDVQFEKDVNKN
jgi:hypothetical protein